ncbi:ABC transporter permease [Cuniculiplasma divulgatum]|jgi:ABC-2 type transport system permease protein|uniref:DrugE1 family ABC transporter permease n=1 Tax=Cuniculiplasma divulgatum TaxID=1673428 RepID=A0A1N5U2N7_9ARCH|nr:ABC transporter permease [Cuniculiplasma divulgatum]MCI2411729.1 ABC transporter permease [Cuniculiplasma sp.]SIM54607.1 DrugE1 family ABC transporter permease [Cuniculiplasma divulgatum]SJK84617.1 DrugE1 family ABC transporter permease [Cuniculiplasma divulgatum]
MSGLGPLTVRELKKWYRNPVFFITGLLQPFFWIALFGSAFDITKFFPGASELILDGAPNYITYIVGGVLTISSLFTAMFAGTNIIFDRRLGPMGRFLSSPIRRSSIVFSKILSSTIRVMPQALILILAALVIPNGLKFVHGFTVLDALVIIAAIILVSFIFSSIFSVIAIRMTNMNSIFGIVNLVNLPLLFVSYAMFSSSMMASWLSSVAAYNPVSWSAEAMRMVIINGNLTGSQWIQVGQWLGALAILALGLLLLTAYLAEKEIRD